jgi:signal transduction histidine kinase
MAATPEVQKRMDYRLAGTVITLTLLILGAGIGTVTLHLRTLIVEQLLQQDAEVLHAVTMLQQLQTEGEEVPQSEDPADQLDYILNTSTVRESIVAIRLFSTEGEFIGSFPKGVMPSQITPEDLSELRASQPVSHFRKSVKLEDVFQDKDVVEGNDPPLPFIHALVPLKVKEKFIGAVEFILDGTNAATAVAKMERNLYRYAFLIFAGGGTMATIGLIIAFGRLERANRLLRERTERLVQANHELIMAAKTSAIGAVTAHLLHGLKNPLFGLQTFVSARPGTGGESEEEWNEARQSTRRMQTMINDVVRILREESSGGDYELSCGEILELVKRKLGSVAREAQVELTFSNSSGECLPNRDANLIVLILSNLVQNAIQALPEGGKVMVESREGPEDLLFGVADNGPGLPAEVMQSLFSPTISGKEGGTGLGLAISKQLANHLGADLSLAANSREGARFELRFKKVVLHGGSRPVAADSV